MLTKIRYHSSAWSLIHDHVYFSRTPQKHDIEQLIHSHISSLYNLSILQFCLGICFKAPTGRRLHTLGSHCYQNNWSQQITFYILVDPLLHVDSHLFGIISVFTIVTKETILAILPHVKNPPKARAHLRHMLSLHTAG